MHARRSRIWTALGALMLVASIGACASTGEGAEGETTLIVENDLIASSALTVYAVPEVGSRSLIGTVAAGETKTLRFTPFGAGTQYQFMAETTAGGDLVSHPISFSPGATLRWNIDANIVNVVESG